MNKKTLISLQLVLCILFSMSTFTQTKDANAFSKMRKKQLSKSFGQEDRRQGIHSGNLIRTLFHNYGSIGFPYTVPAVEWPKGTNHNYIFEFGVIAAAEVISTSGDTIHIVSEGIIGGIADEGGDLSPDGKVWGWQPLPGYTATGQNNVAMSDKPETWPETWPGRGANWDGAWPGEFGLDVAIADQESYYIMDDRENAEFAYFPDSQDSTRRGLGLQVETRGYQWAHPLAEDCIFWVYEITNVGDKDLDKVVFGMYGDADVGGADDWNDDDSFFDIDLDMVYQWDHDNRGIWGGEVGYFGYKYLESPGNPFDGIDNDNDGMIDERRDDGIDNDGDWREERDDVGADGIPDTGDDGEGDGVPTAGEPNFDATDIDESDQIGLTSFNAFVWPNVRVSDDEEIWNRLTPGFFPQPPQTVDIVFLYGSGYFPLKAGQTQRFSIALLLGEDQEDLFRNADVVQKIYNSNYRFARAPDKPTVTAVPGDGRVTLYWDKKAEFSLDPVTGEDFEGYKIYRATDPGFNEVRTITDGDGNLTFYEPIAQFDLVNEVAGFHPVDINGVQFELGSNTGLQHTWTDSTVTNGVTYYYAVVSYDRGDINNLISPSECTKVIDIDEAGNLQTDINTVIVTPNQRPVNYTAPALANGIEKVSGPGTGDVRVNLIDPFAIQNGVEYEISFNDTLLPTTTYQVRRKSPDLDQSDVLIDKSSLLNGEEGNPVFDGIHLFVNEDTLLFDPENSRWLNGETNYAFTGGLFINSEAYPADYEIRFGVEKTDDVFNLPVPFEIWNVTDNQESRFGLVDNDANGEWSSGDAIVILLGEDGVVTSWQAIFTAPADNPLPPAAGDIFHYATTKPFTSDDVYRFTTVAAQSATENNPDILDAIAVVPNPYVATNIFEPPNNQLSGRGERRIHFINVPVDATIRIFTVNGNLVQTLHHDGGLASGTVSWNLLSKDGIGVAYGIYIYHVEAEGIGEKVGKFALIK